MQVGLNLELEPNRHLEFGALGVRVRPELDLALERKLEAGFKLELEVALALELHSEFGELGI